MIFLHQSKTKEAMKWRSRLQQMDFPEQDNTLLYMWTDIQILGCFQDAAIKFCQMVLFLSISGQSNSQAILPKINEELLKNPRGFDMHSSG
jgi:hypothetical protein